MKIGDKFVKDCEVVEIVDKFSPAGEECIVFTSSQKEDRLHILFKYDFLKQYKPYEPVYEYKYAFNDIISGVLVTDGFYTDKEALCSIENKKQRLDFTKRERVQ